MRTTRLGHPDSPLWAQLRIVSPRETRSQDEFLAPGTPFPLESCPILGLPATMGPLRAQRPRRSPPQQTHSQDGLVSLGPLLRCSFRLVER